MKITKSTGTEFAEHRATRLPSIVVACTVLLSFGIGTGLARAADALNRIVQFDIPANTSLEDALINWGTQAKVTVMINTSDVAGHLTQQVQGKLNARSALSLILRDSGLSFTEEGDRVRIIPAMGFVHSALLQDHLRTLTSTQTVTKPSLVEEGSGALDTVPLQNRLEEVVVTSQKREERLQDVPIPISVVDTTALMDNNELRIQDYATRVPGLNISPGVLSNQTIVIRGITTGNTLGSAPSPTVGIMVDDSPYSASMGGLGQVVPDIDPNDLARIEVLKGPQGTLWGASSMGGLVRFITVDPSTSHLSGRIEAGTDTVYNGAELGYSFRGSLNVPLSDTLAVRVSAFTREDPGYLDNPTLDIRGINEDRADGVRLAALWKPSDIFSVKLSTLYQTIKGDGTNDSTPSPGLTDLQQDYARGVGPYERQLQAYSLEFHAKLGSVDLTSVTAYNVNSLSDSFDLTSFFGSFFAQPQSAGGYGVDGATSRNVGRSSLASEELRLATPLGNSIDMLVGLFYEYGYSPDAQYWDPINPISGVIPATWGDFSFTSRLRSYAAFANFTYHVTDKFDIQIGGREDHDNTWTHGLTSGPYCQDNGASSSPCFRTDQWNTSHAVTYLVSPSYKISPSLMVYSRVATGFRPGGDNAPLPGIPLVIKPDTTTDYEIGVKGDLFDRSLSVDMSVYYIDWKDIQIGLFSTADSQNYTGNAGSAKSQGLELSSTWNPVSGVRVSGWLAWNDAVLTEPFPPSAVTAGTYAYSGERLPLSSRWSGNISLDDEFPITHSVTGVVGGSVSYVGDRINSFQQAPDQPLIMLPSYVRTDLHAGVRYESWNANLYANNVTDRRGVLAGAPVPGGNNYPPYSTYYIQPRTVGIALSKSF